MFGDVNDVTLLGNVTNDPDLRYTTNGTPVLSFGLATNRRYLDKKTDEWKDDASFHNITVWRSAENLAKRINKGTRIYVQGRLNTDSWEGDDGKKRYKTEVIANRVLLIDRYEGGSNEELESKSQKKSSKKGGDNSSAEIDPNDLPF
jgi:single-strand DNA-binding protein